MKEMFARLAQKAKENKEVLIKIGAAVGGALIGALVVSAITHYQDETHWTNPDDELDSIDQEETEDEESEE